MVMHDLTSLSAVLRGACAGVHINGYVETPSGLEIWVARRSRSKATWPGKLDHIVAGGQPAGMTCAANVIKARRLRPLIQQLPLPTLRCIGVRALGMTCAANVIKARPLRPLKQQLPLQHCAAWVCVPWA